VKGIAAHIAVLQSEGVAYMAEDVAIEELLALARAGDVEGRNRLFARCRNYLNVVAQTQVEAWLRAKVDASDIVQQTLLEAHRDFARFRGGTEAEWLGWLRQILVHNAAGFVRQFSGTEKRQIRLERPLESPGDDSSHPFARPLADPGETPSEQLIRREQELQLAEALATLEPDYREVIALRNLQRLPFDEVARRMGRSRPAVQMLWMRAIRRLERKVRAGGGDASS
jgi:RNA polymerase sigma-70 factor (ECF subfamily)